MMHEKIRSAAPVRMRGVRGSVPRVSLILPVHNGAAFVKEAIDSILAQSFTDFELICVDDGSSDATPEILAAQAAIDGRIRIVTNRPNKGLPGALNSGFAVARGELHSWTSDDNILRPFMLERLVAALDASPQTDVVHSAFTVIDEAGSFLYRMSVGPVSELLDGNNVGASFMYRASVTEALGGYDEALFGVEDYDFWLRAARQFRFLSLPDDLYLYRRHGGSLTDRKARQIHRLCTQVIEREAALQDDPRKTASALLGIALKTRIEMRFDLVLRALQLSPHLATTEGVRIARWFAGWLVRRIIPG